MHNSQQALVSVFVLRVYRPLGYPPRLVVLMAAEQLPGGRVKLQSLGHPSPKAAEKGWKELENLHFVQVSWRC